MINVKLIFKHSFVYFLCVLFFALIANSTMAQINDVFRYWSDEEELSWKDFHGTEDDTTFCFGMHLGYDQHQEKVMKWPTKFSYWTVTPVIFLYDSYVDDSLKTDCNLKFRQTLFDYRELNCRKATLDYSKTLGGNSRYDILVYYGYQINKSKEIKDFYANSSNGTIKDTVDAFYNYVKQELTSISVTDSIKNINYGYYSVPRGVEIVMGACSHFYPTTNTVFDAERIGTFLMGMNFYSRRNCYGMSLTLGQRGISKQTMIATEDDTINVNEKILSNYLALQYERKIIDNKYVSVGPVISLGSVYYTSSDKNKNGEVDFLAFRLGVSANLHCFSFVNLLDGLAGGNSLRLCPYIQYQRDKDYGKVMSWGLETTYIFNISAFHGNMMR